MNSDPTLIYILIFVLAAIALVGIALAISYSSLFLKYKNLKEEMLKQQEKEGEKSLLILDQAQATAKEIISKAHTITNNNSSDLLKLVNENLKMQKTSYDQAFSIISQNVTKNFEQLPVDVKKEIEIEIQKLVTLIQQDMEAVKTSVFASLQKPFELAQKEAEAYKKERIKAFEEKLFSILSDVSKEVLRKELTVSEHEKLVVTALEELKERGGA